MSFPYKRETSANRKKKPGAGQDNDNLTTNLGQRFLKNFSLGEHFAVGTNAEGIFEIPFIDRMGFVFIISILGMIIISKFENRKGIEPKGLVIEKSMFAMSPSFQVGTLIVAGIITALYTLFW